MMRCTWSRSCQAIALLLTLSLTLGGRSVSANESSELLSLSIEFESARVSGDVEAAKRLILPGAHWIKDLASETVLILPDIEAVSRQLSNGAVETDDSFVAERSVEIHGASAIVTELVRVTSKKPQPPLRRSIVWVREADGWKIAHIHMSPYLRWEAAIAEFEIADRQDPPKPGGVVFVGSSSVRRWETLKDDFPGVQVLNRGFGGSQMIDSVLAAKRIVTPYSPAAVVVYEGDNDIGKGKSAERVLDDFRNFVGAIHEELPEAKIGFIAIKPSLKRWAQWAEIERANQLIRQFAASQPHVSYLDIASPMLNAEGMPREELFVSDGLHLSEQGYAVWTEVIRPWVNLAALAKSHSGE